VLATPVRAADPAAAARRSLRAQIARLEGELAAVLTSTYPRVTAPADPPPRPSVPRLLDLGELEVVRDTLAARVSTVHRRAAAQAEAQAAARARLQAMLADPQAFRGDKIANRELGLPGCTTYAVLPRLGPVGLLTGWWRVKISSGCPRAGGPGSGRPPVLR
jgi:hypothetical protein